MRVNRDCDQTNSATGSAGPVADETGRNDLEKLGGRALVPLFPVQPSARPHAAIRQPAGFLAHLIATRQALPQTRERRRIEPDVAAAIYSAACITPGMMPTRSGHEFSRSM
jgi:hypothetical protein